MKNTSVKINMKPLQHILKKRGLESKGKVQKFLTLEIYKQSDKYTPFRRGILKTRGNVEIGDNYIKYLSPYSRYLWYGKVMIGRAPKKATKKNLTYQGAPIRGPFWITRMWSDKGTGIVQSAARYAGGRSKR